MGVQDAVIIVLGALLLTAAVALIAMLRKSTQRQETAPLDLRRHWLDSAADGTIQRVAGSVSNSLKSTFRAGRIIFLRKQRGSLELNYHYGLKDVDRRAFRFPYTDDLLEAVRTDYVPRPIQHLEGILPESVRSLLSQHEIKCFFPVFWKENLYGIYFTDLDCFGDGEAVCHRIGAMVHALSAAYHIKWHETRYERLSGKLEAKSAGREGRQPSARAVISLLQLVKYKNPDTLLPKMLQAIRDEMQVRRLLCIFQNDQSESPVSVLSVGASGRLIDADRSVLGAIVAELGEFGIRNLSQLTTEESTADAWIARAVEAGFGHAATLSLSSGRTGLLLFDGKISEQLEALWSQSLGTTAADLLDNAESYEQFEALSYTDSLTGLANKRYLLKRLDEEIGRARRYSRSMGFIMFDMDQLKHINDLYGHLAGDTVLRRLGEILRNSIRAIDIVARYGGDEFCVVMPEADEATCQRFMVRLREQIASSEFELHGTTDSMTCTISQGAAVYPEHGEDGESLIFAADMALLRAKEAGRNSHLMFTEELLARASKE